MIYDISLIYSDGATPEDVRINNFINRDTLARWFNTYPKIIDEMNAMDYNFGLFCAEAYNIAQERKEKEREMEQKMQNW